MAVIGAVPAASLRRKRCWRQRDERGQMTVELCIVFPVAIVIAVIAVNALLFFGQCSSFDRAARNAVRVIAASPPMKEAPADLAARIEAMVEAELRLDAGTVECVALAADDGVDRFRITHSFAPTLFGMGLRTQIWGVPVPKLSHATELALDRYAPDAQVMPDG